MKQNNVEEDVTVVNICERLNYIPVIANWLWDFWNTKYPSWDQWKSKYSSVDDFVKYINHIIDTKGIESLPRVYVAEHEGEAVGVVFILSESIPGRENLSPYATMLYVIKPFRGKGVDSLLLNHCKDVVKNLGYKSVYFYTSLKNYYDRKKEANYIGLIEVAGKSFHLYEAKIDSDVSA